MTTLWTNDQPSAPSLYREEMRAVLGQVGKVRDVATAIAQRAPRALFFVGGGASLAAASVAADLLEQASDLPVFLCNAAEFALHPPKLLGPDSVVIALSQSGSTDETVRSAAVARERGALVVGIAKSPDAKMFASADFGLTTEAEALDAVMDAQHVMLFALAAETVRAAGWSPDAEGIVRAVYELPSVVFELRDSFQDQLDAIAAAVANEEHVDVVAGGPSFGVGYTFAMSCLGEALWIQANWLHANELFHGSLELMTSDSCIIVLQAEDWSRPLTERAINFAEGINANVHVIDTRTAQIPGLDAAYRSLFSPIFLSILTVELAFKISALKGHSLLERRYMWKNLDY